MSILQEAETDGFSLSPTKLYKGGVMTPSCTINPFSPTNAHRTKINQWKSKKIPNETCQRIYKNADKYIWKLSKIIASWKILPQNHFKIWTPDSYICITFWITNSYDNASSYITPFPTRKMQPFEKQSLPGKPSVFHSAQAPFLTCPLVRNTLVLCLPWAPYIGGARP